MLLQDNAPAPPHCGNSASVTPLKGSGKRLWLLIAVASGVWTDVRFAISCDAVARSRLVALSRFIFTARAHRAETPSRQTPVIQHWWFSPCQVGSIADTQSPDRSDKLRLGGSGISFESAVGSIYYAGRKQEGNSHDHEH